MSGNLDIIRSKALYKLASPFASHGGLRKNYKRNNRHNRSKESTYFWSNVGNALKAGQLPIPYVTVGPKIKNKPIEVPAGEPVYIGMTGAGPWSNIQDKIDQEGFFWQRGNKNNMKLFRWFDRDQARKEIEELAKTHPVHTFGESYGGSAMSDTVGKINGNVASLVMYDPVGWANPKSPANVDTTPVNINPHYRTMWSNGNIVATIGGRRQDIEGTEKHDYYKNDFINDYGPGTPEKPGAMHYGSSAALEDEIRKKYYEHVRNGSLKNLNESIANRDALGNNGTNTTEMVSNTSIAAPNETDKVYNN